MGKKAVKSKLYAARLFMRNGSTFTVRYARLSNSGSGEAATTTYYGQGELRLGEIRDNDIIARVEMLDPESFGIDVSGYKF